MSIPTTRAYQIKRTSSGSHALSVQIQFCEEIFESTLSEMIEDAGGTLKAARIRPKDTPCGETLYNVSFVAVFKKHNDARDFGTEILQKASGCNEGNAPTRREKDRTPTVRRLSHAGA